MPRSIRRYCHELHSARFRVSFLVEGAHTLLGVVPRTTTRVPRARKHCNRPRRNCATFARTHTSALLSTLDADGIPKHVVFRMYLCQLTYTLPSAVPHMRGEQEEDTKIFQVVAREIFLSIGSTKFTISSQVHQENSNFYMKSRPHSRTYRFYRALLKCRLFLLKSLKSDFVSYSLGTVS